MPAAWAAGAAAIAGTVGSVAAGSAQQSGAKKAAKAQAKANQQSIDLQRQTYDQQRQVLAEALAGQGQYTEEQKNALAQSYQAQQDAANQAYERQVAAAERAWALQQGFQDPWFQVGKRSINKLENRPDFAFTAEDFNKHLDPGYAFRLKQGQQALDRTASARGGLLSGGALRAATEYGQEMGSQEFMNAYNRALQTDTTNYNRLANLSQWGQHSADVLTAAAGDYGNNLAAYAGQRGGNLAGYAGQYGSNLADVIGQRGSQIGQYGTNLANMMGAYGQNVGSIYMNTGQSNANSLMAQANAQANMYAGIGSAIGQGASAYGNYKMNQAGLDAYNRRTDAMATGGYGTGINQRAGAFSTPSSGSTPAYRGGR